MKLKLIAAAIMFALAAPVTAQQTPEQMSTVFFETLKADRAEAAIRGLTEGSLVAKKTTELQAIVGQLTTTRQVFGPIGSITSIKTKKLGDDLTESTYIINYKEAPLKAVFVHYRSLGTWKIANFRFDDQLQTWFDD